MSRNTVTITDTSLSVEPHGLDKMWSYTSRLEFPLAHVRGATHDPGLRHEPKGWRGPGLQAGSKLSGTFHADGTAQFWNISGYENTLVVTLEDERFTHLYLTVDDPAGLAAQINAAIRPAQAQPAAGPGWAVEVAGERLARNAEDALAATELDAALAAAERADAWNVEHTIDELVADTAGFDTPPASSPRPPREPRASGDEPSPASTEAPMSA